MMKELNLTSLKWFLGSHFCDRPAERSSSQIGLNENLIEIRIHKLKHVLMLKLSQNIKLKCDHQNQVDCDFAELYLSER